MILKKLMLENIRSYRDQIVEFPLGKTLFEGDIGSGKSTILMAIEFALFGLGSVEPGSLLKVGESEGSVSIIFESDGKEYTVQRHLVKRRNSFVQDDCALRTVEGVTKYSASEIKGRVLEILDFNEPPDPKAQSLIYRYAIYTPQEELKSILILRPDIRLQTLRKAFRIEDYKTANENTKNLLGEMKQRVRDLENLSSDIPTIKTKMEQLRQWIDGKEEEIHLLEKKQQETRNILDKLKEKRDGLREEQVSLKKESVKIETLNNSIREKNEEMRSSTNQIQSLNSKIKLIETKISELRLLDNPCEQTKDELQDRILLLEKKQKKYESEEIQIRTKCEDYKSIMEEKVCPTCDRPIETYDFSGRLKHRQIELVAAHKQVVDGENEIRLMKESFDQKLKYDQARSKLDDLTNNLEEYMQDLKMWQAKLANAKKFTEQATSQLAVTKTGVQKLENIESDLKLTEDKISESTDALQDTVSAVRSGKDLILNWERESKEHEKAIKKKLEQKATADKLKEYLIWVQEYFVPTVELIEKQVMTNINVEFASQFQKWFAMLVDDPGKQAKIDEEFTPIIQQDGIDQDVSYLSGGEKTSVALAYRLALNNIVRKVSAGMHSNVLILDEPTDGFSKEQLGRVREILDELQCPQIILVSHEKELESFADQIYRVNKIDGVSTISVGR